MFHDDAHRMLLESLGQLSQPFHVANITLYQAIAHEAELTQLGVEMLALQAGTILLVLVARRLRQDEDTGMGR